MAKEKSMSKNVTIYMPDREIFENLCTTTTKMWYGKTGKVMTKSEVITKALLYFKSYLTDEEDATPPYSSGVDTLGRLSR